MTTSSLSEIDANRIKHLEFIQGVITRLANNSFLIKGWTLTIAAALFAVAASKLNWIVGLTALVPILAFWELDAYFLRQERGYRCLYDAARLAGSAVEIYSMDIRPYLGSISWSSVIFSRGLVGFYTPLAVIDVVSVLAGIVAAAT